MAESDTFTLSKIQIKAILPNPVEKNTGTKLAYFFSVAVNGKKVFLTRLFKNLHQKMRLSLLYISEFWLQLTRAVMLREHFFLRTKKKLQCNSFCKMGTISNSSSNVKNFKSKV